LLTRVLGSSAACEYHVHSNIPDEHIDDLPSAPGYGSASITFIQSGAGGVRRYRVLRRARLRSMKAAPKRRFAWSRLWARQQSAIVNRRRSAPSKGDYVINFKEPAFGAAMAFIIDEAALATIALPHSATNGSRRTASELATGYSSCQFPLRH
jgi:hypothetical protein